MFYLFHEQTVLSRDFVQSKIQFWDNIFRNTRNNQMYMYKEIHIIWKITTQSDATYNSEHSLFWLRSKCTNVHVKFKITRIYQETPNLHFDLIYQLFWYVLLFASTGIPLMIISNPERTTESWQYMPTWRFWVCWHCRVGLGVCVGSPGPRPLTLAPLAGRSSAGAGGTPGGMRYSWSQSCTLWQPLNRKTAIKCLRYCRYDVQH